MTWPRRAGYAAVLIVGVLVAFDYAMSGSVSVFGQGSSSGMSGPPGPAGPGVGLDLGDDGGNDSLTLAEIATTGTDVDSVFTECADNKLCISMNAAWPQARAFETDPDGCIAGMFATDQDSEGNFTCGTPPSGDVTGGSSSITNGLALYGSGTGKAITTAGFNSSCTALDTPYDCCMGSGTGTCDVNVSAGTVSGFVGLTPNREKAANGSVCIQESIDNCSSFGTSACEDFCFTLPTAGLTADTNFRVDQFANSQGQVYAGVHDFDSVTSLLIPVGANPSVATAGDVAIDTTANQLKYQSSGTTRVLSPVRTECAVIENLAAADDSFEFFMADAATTITSVGCRCRGTCTGSATFTLEDRGGVAMTITGTNPTCATTGNATFAAVTASNALVAGEGLAFDVTNTPNPETDEYTLCVTRTLDAQ
jgi:hypothetical protein